MRRLKAAIIGAGSTYTPELIEGFIEFRDSLDFRQFYLMDIDSEKLRIVGELTRRMFKNKGIDAEIVCTLDLDDAILGADYIFSQIRVGGLEARIRDEKIPLKYGLLGQETTGIGGFMCALRTIPVMLDIARKIEKLAPNAWLINFSNPSGLVAQALLENTNVKTIGLCNNAVNMLATVERVLGTSDFNYDYVGLNHLSWITSVTHNGEEKIQELCMESANMKNIPELEYDKALLDAIPAMPCAYLSYFYLREEQLKKCLEAEKSRGEVCMELEASLLERFSNPNLSEKPEELSKRGGALYSKAAVTVVDAIENDRNEFHVVNVRNGGAQMFMDDDDVVEAKCRIGKNGAAPAPVTTGQNGYIIGLMRAVKAYERLAVSAAVNNSYSDAIAALMVHPLIGDYKAAKAALDDMLEQNREFVTLEN